MTTLKSIPRADTACYYLFKRQQIVVGPARFCGKKSM